MAGILDGSLADAIYAGFKGRLLTGLIRQSEPPVSGALDALGDPIDLATTDTAIEGFYEDYDSAYLARAGIPGDSVKVSIFAKSAPDIEPGKDDIVKLVQAGSALWFQVRRVQTDPAKALWVLPDAFRIPDPDA
jgi:hypothetical protein